jgi:hypothetical protein
LRDIVKAGVSPGGRNRPARRHCATGAVIGQVVVATVDLE